jgi:hypothetical protein
LANLLACSRSSRSAIVFTVSMRLDFFILKPLLRKRTIAAFNPLTVH